MTSSVRHALWLALTIGLLLASNTALGDTLEQQLDLNEEALGAAADKDYERAISLLRDSLDLGELNVTWLNLGRIYFLTGHCRQSLDAYERVERAPAVEEPPPEVIAKALERYMDELEARCMGMLTVKCEPASMRMSVDGRPMRCGVPLELLVGRARVRGSLGEESVELSVEIRTGPNPPVSLRLPGSSLVEGPKEDEASEGAGLRVAGWVAAGLGVTTAAVGVALRVGLSDDLDELNSISETVDGDLERFNELKASVESQQTTAFALIGAGGALVATSAVLLWLGYTDDEDPPEARSGGWRLHIGALGVSVERRF